MYPQCIPELDLQTETTRGCIVRAPLLWRTLVHRFIGSFCLQLVSDDLTCTPNVSLHGAPCHGARGEFFPWAFSSAFLYIVLQPTPYVGCTHFLRHSAHSTLSFSVSLFRGLESPMKPYRVLLTSSLFTETNKLIHGQGCARTSKHRGKHVDSGLSMPRNSCHPRTV